MAALEADARAARATELHTQVERHEQKALDPTSDPTAQKRAATLASKRRAALERLEGGAVESDDDDDDSNAQGGSDLPRHQVAHERDGTPKENAQRNFTDADSRIMVRDGDHYVQAYNAQAVVDNAHQIVVSTGVGNQAPDVEYLTPMLERASANLAAAGVARPASAPVAADAGYFSEANVASAEKLGFDPYIAPERSKRMRPELAPPGATGPPLDEPVDSGRRTPKDAMRAKLKTKEGTRIYGLRKTTPEPVFGQILEVRGFRRFLMRGLEKVNGEWTLVTLTHNVLKLWRSGRTLATGV
jgi:IS5 family transposase